MKMPCITLGHFLSSEYDQIIPLAGGNGGQGTVFKARHREFDQLRAVKWLHGTIESDPADSSQPNKTSRLYEVFIREAHSSANRCCNWARCRNRASTCIFLDDTNDLVESSGALLRLTTPSAKFFQTKLRSDYE